MKYVIQGFKPEKMFRYFEEISAIPRGSGNEKQAADYIEKFAAERGLYCIRDSFDNVFIRKKASEGYEGHEPVLLQGHIDMVCEKNGGTVHDFENEGLDLYVKDGMLRANGTTLGGDDGAAVALMLAALDDGTLEHPVLECLFTTGEETGMYGAAGFDYSNVTARKMINLDSEEEGTATVGCAGGIGLSFTLKADRLPLAEIGRPLSISITGLAGGHSGEDIVYERGNANVLMFRLLDALYEKHPFNLVTVNGGSKTNAIPRECEAVILISEPAEATEFAVRYATDVIAAWLPAEDSKFRIRVGRAKGKYEKMLSFSDTSKLISLCSFIPNGVISRIPCDLAAVETSNNFGIVSDRGDGGIVAVYHGRSSADQKLEVLERQAKRAAKVLGMEFEAYGKYTGWAMERYSAAADEYLSAANEVLGEGRARVAAIHAGLECGIICGAIPGLDAVSIGPDIKNIHTPDEALDLRSFENLWEIVKRMLKM